MGERRNRERRRAATLTPSEAISASDSPRSTGIGRTPVCLAAPTVADPPRWPIQFSRKLGIQASSRLYRLVLGFVVDNPKTPEYALHMDVRLNVDLPLLLSEAVEVVVIE